MLVTWLLQILKGLLSRKENASGQKVRTIRRLTVMSLWNFVLQSAEQPQGNFYLIDTDA